MIAEHRTGLLLAATGAALFALRPVLVKLIYTYPLDPVTVLLWRMLFALPCYLIVGIYIYRVTNQALASKTKLVVSAAAVGILAYYFAALFDLIGLQYVSAQLGRMVLYTYPTFVVLFGLLFFGQTARALTWIALLISYAGVALIFTHDLNYYGQEVVRGLMWIIASAICFSLYLLLSKKLIEALGSMLYTCIAMGAATIAICIHYAAINVDQITRVVDAGLPHRHALVLILVMSIVSTVIPSFMISAAIKRIGAPRTGIAGTFGPAMTAVFAVLLIGEPFTWYHLTGMVLVISAISLITRAGTEG